MNIAILIPNLIMGGAERAASSIGGYYHDKGHKVYYFLLANCSRLFFEAKGEVVKTHVFYPFSEKSHIDNIREMLFAAKKFKKLKKEYQIDVAISFMEACNFINICSRGKEKVFVSVRTVLSERPEYSGFLYNKRWIRNLYKKADRIIAVSTYVKNDLCEKYRIYSGKIAVIPNVSVQHELMQKENSLWKYGNRVIVCVGRLDPVKQHECVIRAFSCVNEKMPDARLVIVGDGKQKNYLKSICKELGLEKSVIFVGASVNVGYFFHHERVFVMY